MFTALPPRYDLVNHVITWGLDSRWRHLAAQECLKAKPKRVLDLCCGTGDLAINIARLARGPVELVGLDYSQPMLEIAAQKAERLAPQRKISFVHGDATDLHFPDGYFDCVGISFAFRNLTYRNPVGEKHFAEVLRVLKQGGRYVIIETSQPESRVIRGLFRKYLRWYVYTAGTVVSGNRGAYKYLSESAARFYSAAEVKGMLLKAGFRDASHKPLLFGAVAIYVGVK